MINVGKGRWPLMVGIPCVAASVLFWRGIVRLNYEAHAVLSYSGNVKEVDPELKMFRAHPGLKVVYSRVPGQALQLEMRTEGSRPDDVVKRLLLEGQASIAES